MPENIAKFEVIGKMLLFLDWRVEIKLKNEKSGSKQNRFGCS
jgi:hypothetical protein